MAISMDYGNYLNMAFDFFSLYKDQNGIRGVTFKQWLDVNVGISDSYGRKLRKISKDFIMFPKLKKLGISFSECGDVRKTYG